MCFFTNSVHLYDTSGSAQFKKNIITSHFFIILATYAIRINV